MCDSQRSFQFSQSREIPKRRVTQERGEGQLMRLARNENLALFSYVNSGLFEGHLQTFSFDAAMRRAPVDTNRFDWFGGHHTLESALELGLRFDGGDAKSGTGVELGSTLRYADTGTGLAVDISGRTLLAHADTSYHVWGACAGTQACACLLTSSCPQRL